MKAGFFYSGIVALSLYPVFPFPDAVAAEEILLDEIAAVVTAKIPLQQGTSIITAWDLEAQCRLELVAHYGRDGLEREVSDTIRLIVLQRLVEETVVFMESGRLGFKDIDEAVVKQKIEELSRHFGSEEEMWQQLGRFSIGRKHLFAWFDRSVRVERYIATQQAITRSASNAVVSLSETEKNKFRRKLIEYIGERYRIWIFIGQESERGVEDGE